MKLQAVLWDVDGTIAETERDGHRIAFNLAFEAHGLPWQWSVERYGELLLVTGGRERLLHDMATRSDAPSMTGERDALARSLRVQKNELYAQIIQAQGIPFRPGVQNLMEECLARNVRMAITTTTSRSNVGALMCAHLGESWKSWFPVMVCGEDVAQKKPNPEVYVRALQLLKLNPLDTLALEDSPGGVAAACAAQIPVVVTRSVYFDNATVEGAIAIGPGLHQRTGWRPLAPEAPCTNHIGLDDLLTWRDRMEHTSQFE